MQLVNPSFKIQATPHKFDSTHLYLEVGPMGISMLVIGDNKYVDGIVTYAFAAGISENDMAEKAVSIFKTDQLLQRNFTKVHICWSFAESIIAPNELIDIHQKDDLLNLVFGDAKNFVTCNDFIYKNNLHNLFRVPQSIMKVVSTNFPIALQTHLFSILINHDLPEGNHLFTIFYNNILSIIACKEGKLQIVQNFEYTSPDDCVFYMLNICKGFAIDPDTVNLHISGMIDVNSGLFGAIYKYFIQIDFQKLPESFIYPPELLALPNHFFYHLFLFSTCES